MSEDKLRTEVAMCVRMLEHLGLIDYSGHVSCRIPDTDTIFINSWGASRHGLGPQDIVKSDLDANPLKRASSYHLKNTSTHLFIACVRT